MGISTVSRHAGNVSSGFQHSLWTVPEDNIIRRCYPDYDALFKQLPHRSRSALKNRAQKLRVFATTRRFWTGSEICTLRKLWKQTPKAELLAAFPGRTWASLDNAAQTQQLRRDRRPRKTTGIAELDTVRRRCEDLNLTLKDLDTLCGFRNYFTKSARGRKPRARMLLKAIAVLDGHIEIVWH